MRYPQSLQAQQQEHALHDRRCDDHPHNHSPHPGNRHLEEMRCPHRARVFLGWTRRWAPRPFLGVRVVRESQREKRAPGGELTDRYNPRVFTSRERSFGPPCLDAFHLRSMGGYDTDGRRSGAPDFPGRLVVHVIQI